MSEDEKTGIIQYSNQASNLVMDQGSMDSMMRMAEVMADGSIQTPEHFRGKPADCLAVVMQSVQWGMNPFIVAQKTFLVGGKLGYEAQLVNSVALSCGAFKDEPEFEFIGDWNKILGNIKEMPGKNGGKKWYAQGWDKKDEKGLGVICSVPMGSSGKLRKITVMMAQCFPRFSTQWATNPQQQITYSAVKQITGRYAPGAILGVYSVDELMAEPEEIDITPPKEEVRPTTANELPEYPKEKFDTSKGAWLAIIQSGKKNPEDIIKTISSKFKLSESQEKEIKALNVKSEPPVDESFVDDDQFTQELGDIEE